MKTNCIVCEAEVDNWDIAYDAPTVHPIGGTIFRTYGNYGSSVFDPMDATYRDAVICDSCLKTRFCYTYPGENKAYAEELEKERAAMDEILDCIIAAGGTQLKNTESPLE